MNKRRRTIPFLLAAVVLLAAETPLERIGFPLAIDDGVSSTFGEFRNNHFHAGLDLRTRKQTGFAVRAVADGTVERITVSRRGFGRALLLRHAGGATSLYSHLERFRPDLEAEVERLRARRGEKYFGDHVLAAPPAVSRGETIAFSGESGAGFPHLHVEIRDRAGYALNPLMLLEQPPADDRPPWLKGVLLRSRSGSLVNGDLGEFYFPLRRREALYRPAAPLRVSGPCDVVLHAVDLTGVGRSVAPFRLEALLDGRPLFAETFDRLCRDDNNQLGMVYDMSHSTASDFFFNLCSQEGFALEQTGGRLAEELERLLPGAHELRIVVEDCQGNRSQAAVPIEKEAAAGRPPATRRFAATAPGAGMLRDCEVAVLANRGEVMVKVGEFPAPASQLRLRIVQGSEEGMQAGREYSRGVFFSFQPLNHEVPLRILIERVDNGLAVESRQLALHAVWLKNHLAQKARLGDFSADFGATSVREPTVLLLEEVERQAELPLLATPLRAYPEHFAFLDAVFFKFRPPAAIARPDQVGIFKQRPTGGNWVYLPTRYESGSGCFSCRVLSGGTYALLRDVLPPDVSLETPHSRHAGRLRRLVVRIRDRGKGVRDESLSVFLNGARLDVEYDPDWGHVLIEDLQALTRGENRLQVRIDDLGGNRSDRSFRFHLR